MNKKLLKLLALPLLGMNCVLMHGQTAMELAAEMYPGWNLGNTLEAVQCTWVRDELEYETGWQRTMTTQEIIDYVKSQGFRSVRIPCSWYEHMDANYNISSRWMARVQEIVDYCIKDSLYVVLNDHFDGGWIERSFEGQTPASVNKNIMILGLMWKQIATRFRDYDHHLLFAGMNEPSAANDNSTDKEQDIVTLRKYEQAFVNAVRQTGGYNAHRVLVVQGPTTDIDLAYQYDAMPQDNVPSALMLEVHFYSPFNFCQMEEDEWWGYRFFYWGTGNHIAATNYNATWGEEEFLKGQMEKMWEKYVSRGIPVYLGEYGALWREMPKGESQNKHNASIYAWYKATNKYAVANGIIPVVWDTNYCERTTGTGTIINRETLTIFNTKAYQGIMEGCAEATWPVTTGIGSVDELSAGKVADRIYDLMGHSLPDIPEHGVYILNGRKYFRK